MRYTTLVVLLAVACPALAANHFPAEAGNWWEFSYLSSQGGWGASRVDSGSVRWEITSVSYFITDPGQTEFTVEQTRSLASRSYTPGILGDQVEWDSVYQPPRVTLDTLVLRGVDGVNGLWFEGDSCWSFVLDPAAGTGDSRVTLVPQTVLYGSDSIQATQVRPDACRAGSDSVVFTDCIEPRYYSTAEGVGPVAFMARSPTCLMDAYWGEEWQLFAAHIATAVAGPAPRAAPARFHRTGATEAYDLCGRRMPAQAVGAAGVVLQRLPGIGVCGVVVR